MSLAQTAPASTGSILLKSPRREFGLGARSAARCLQSAGRLYHRLLRRSSLVPRPRGRSRSRLPPLRLHPWWSSLRRARRRLPKRSRPGWNPLGESLPRQPRFSLPLHDPLLSHPRLRPRVLRRRRVLPCPAPRPRVSHPHLHRRRPGRLRRLLHHPGPLLRKPQPRRPLHHLRLPHR
jgi:hypothetical protein